MKYSRSPYYNHNIKNYTHVILRRVFNIEDSNTLFINLYGTTKININGNIIEVYEPTYNDSDQYTIHINRDVICIGKQQNPSKDFQEYVRLLIYDDRLQSFQVLCKSNLILQLFYSRLSDNLVDKLSRYIRIYNYFGNLSSLFLTGGSLELYLCLNPTHPFIRIRGVDFSFTDDRFVKFLEKFI